MSVKFKMAAAAAVVASLFGSVASTQAATVLKSGDNVAGWTISFPVGISLVVDSPSSIGSTAPTIKLEKFAAFTSTEGLGITFVQTKRSASSTINFVDEAITNLSNQTWGGFQFLLANPTGGVGAKFHSAADVFVPGVDNNFKHVDYSTDTVSYTGGNVAPGTTTMFGFGNGGDLVIDANPNRDGMAKVFTFKEIPTGNMIPLPAAAWSGLSGLVGLAVIGSKKNLKKILA